MVGFEEIEKNDFNLNIPRYIDGQQAEDIQDIEGHLRGGIPAADVDALEPYWVVCPELRHTLFKDNRPGYVDLAIEKATINVKKDVRGAAGETKAETATRDANVDVEIGNWDASHRTFTAAVGSAQDSASSVRITVRRTAARGNPVSLVWGRVLGRTTCDVTATGTASLTRGTFTIMTVDGTSNLWLAGMPNGTIANPGNPHSNPDIAGQNVAPPALVTGVSVTPGAAMTFDSINGGANNFNTNQLFTPDGNTGWITDNLKGAEHGKSDAWAPINAVMGVFLSAGNPVSAGTPPAALDFSTDQARDFATLAPQLRQVFFIGDGRRADGSVQRFTVPPGATRLFIGTMDQYEWNNNVGSYTVTVHNVGKVTLVK